MARPVPADEAKLIAHRKKRALDTARWRSRQRRGVALYQVEIGAPEFDLCIKFGDLMEDRVGDKAAVAAAVGRLLRRSLISLLNEHTHHRRKNL
jgi:hypothetical protein